MNAFQVWAVALGLVGSIALTAPLHGQGAQGNNNKNKADERKEDERVRAARKAVETAEGQLKDSQRDLLQSSTQLRKTEAAHKSAIDKAQAARRQAEDEHEVKQGMPSLQKQQADLQQAYDAAAAPILERLKASSAYRAAVTAAQAAKNDLQDFKQSPPVAGDRDPRVSELIRTTLKPSELEKQALAEDPAAQAARGRLTAVQDKVAAVRDKVKQAVEGDAAVRSSLKELDRSRAELAKDKADQARIRDKVTAALARVNREKQQLAQAVAADRRDDNKPNKKKNDKQK